MKNIELTPTLADKLADAYWNFANAPEDVKDKAVRKVLLVACAVILVAANVMFNL